MTTTFRRLWIDRSLNVVCCEVGPGQAWLLPRSGEDYKPYNPDKVLLAIKAAGHVNLSRWKRLEEGGVQ